MRLKAKLNSARKLNNYMKTYEFIINKHKSLQHIFEIMFPEFLRHLELR